MLFNSYEFLFGFLPAVLFIYWRLPNQNYRKYWLVCASYVFYAAWSAKFALLMLTTTGVDYFTARYIEDSSSARRRKAWLSVSLVANLGVLAIFKYFDFFAQTINKISPRPVLSLL